jgi:hypothetical protein
MQRLKRGSGLLLGIFRLGECFATDSNRGEHPAPRTGATACAVRFLWLQSKAVVNDLSLFTEFFKIGKKYYLFGGLAPSQGGWMEDLYCFNTGIHLFRP